jgi:hypothetical protein
MARVRGPRHFGCALEAGGFAVADGQQVGQRIVRADRVDEVALEALGDQDCGHRRGVSKNYEAA